MTYRMAWCGLLLVTACGSDVVFGPAGEGSTSSTASSSSATTVGAGGARGTTTATTTTTGAGGGTGGSAPDIAYAACFWAGGLDHIVVKKLEPAAGVCLRLHATWPGAMGPFPEVLGNDDWGVSEVQATTDLTDCLNPQVGGPFGVSSSKASGTFYVPAPPPYPPTFMDLSIQASFDGLPSNVPSTYTFEVKTLPLVYCN